MIEIIEGMRNRNLNDDQWKLVLAIKETHEESLWDAFQQYWKERCDNTSPLSNYDAWEVLDGYAREMFDRADWYRMREYMKNAFYDGRNLSPRDMAEMYISTIYRMQVRFDAKEDSTCTQD